MVEEQCVYKFKMVTRRSRGGYGVQIKEKNSVM